ncbi:glycosyltransferase family 39 protein [Helicobacter cetorum]|uniref:Integral membrane protein n=1 Tax=Helicobacter cetorum (strain ATCC BAA-540 / CCUG 52418 / MIT 99-5656) TaxID=1163745 RepID=I0ERW5_HELCM|nr:glycosyltransferase family 39 protein [Helicobacter cetorum]AFI05684.1 integral membrane protein [Helicobacter cetorum MIT 99-5656]
MQLSPLQSTLLYFRYLIYPRKKIRSFDVSDLSFVLLAMGVLVLGLLMSNEISISYNEAKDFFYGNAWFIKIAQKSTEILGQNDLALRLPFLLSHLINMLLIYLIGRKILKKPKDALYATLTYALLPGANLFAILLVKSVFVLNLGLLISYLFVKSQKIPYLSILLCVFIDSAFITLFLGLGAYALRMRYFKSLLFAFICLGINITLFNESFKGLPSGYFLQTCSELLLLYSPLFFVYYPYTLYKALFAKKPSLLAFISASGWLCPLLLSVRQEIDLKTFAPLALVGLPLFIQSMLSNLRVRLREFRGRYYLRIFSLYLLMLAETLFLWGSKVSNANEKLLNRHFLAKEIATALQTRGIHQIQTDDKQLALRLKFYGIKEGGYLKLINTKNSKKRPDIEIIYTDKILQSYSLVRMRH